MPGDMPVGGIRLDMDVFHAFRDDRPKEEKWELIDGVPIMRPPPSLVHQYISENLSALINARLKATNPAWRAVTEAGVLLAGEEKYNPEPDVTVIDKAVELDQIYATKFHFVAEVLSPNDKPKVLAAKMAYYRAHQSCIAIMFVRQDKVEAQVYLRDRLWKPLTLRKSTNRVEIPGIGDIGALNEIYLDTPLFTS